MAGEKEKTALETTIREYVRDTSGWYAGWMPDLIQKRAYHFFEQRDRVPGHDLEDWLRAEHEVKRHLGL